MFDTVEVPASRLAILEKVEKLANGLFNDPKLGMGVKAAFKEKYPDAILPEVDAFRAAQSVKQEVIGAVDDRIKGLSETMNKFIEESKADRQKANEARENADFTQAIKDAQTRYRLTDEGMQAAFQRMKDQNNPDVEAAAAWVSSNISKAEPVSGSSYTPNNPFGIKFSDRSPDAQYGHFDVQTYEVIHGQRQEVPAEFQKFPDLREAFTAHCLLLMTPWYRAAYAERGNWQKFAALLGPKTPANPQACGYSTQPEYAARLMGAVKDYGLNDPRVLAWYATGTDPGPQIPQIAQMEKSA